MVLFFISIMIFSCFVGSICCLAIAFENDPKDTPIKSFICMIAAISNLTIGIGTLAQLIL